jgi:type II secretory pathway pseudopilin PulG
MRIRDKAMFMKLRHRSVSRRTAFTLVEMLVTITVTLLVMLALVTVFEWIGGRVAEGRAAIEVQNEVRSTSLLLQRDLDRLTVPVRPFAHLEQADGYFYYREGTQWDGTTKTIEGDIDDYLSFTSRNDVEHYTGKYQLGTAATPQYITSPIAEIAWWPQYVDLNDDGALTPDEMQSRVLHRRVLLVKPDLNQTPSSTPQYWFQLPSMFTGATSYNITNQADLANLAAHMRYLYNEVDVSVRLERSLSGSSLTLNVIANSLSDLTNPANRFLRHPMVLRVGANYVFAPAPNFPFAVDTNPQSMTRLELIPLNGSRRGEDVILSSVLAFDVRAFDPEVKVQSGGTFSLLPQDNGWVPATAASSSISKGGFVDLYYSRRYTSNWSAAAASQLSGAPQTKCGIGAGSTEQPFYDTWSFHWEENGYDDNGDGIIDNGTNGIDDGTGVDGTDDPSERETSPPYPVSLRGIQVTLRAYEVDTRQVQQQTVVARFVPE